LYDRSFVFFVGRRKTKEGSAGEKQKNEARAQIEVGRIPDSIFIVWKSLFSLAHLTHATMRSAQEASASQSAFSSLVTARSRRQAWSFFGSSALFFVLAAAFCLLLVVLLLALSVTLGLFSHNKMRISILGVAALLAPLASVQGLSPNELPNHAAQTSFTSRRGLLTSLVATATAASTLVWLGNRPAFAADEDAAAATVEVATAVSDKNLQDVYFGVGCL
jgi:hypothetical protein